MHYQSAGLDEGMQESLALYVFSQHNETSLQTNANWKLIWVEHR